MTELAGWRHRAVETVLTLGAVLGVLCVTWAVCAIAFGLTPLVLVSGSMSPAIEVGDLAVARAVPAERVVEGDVVSVRSPEGVRVTHRVVETHSLEGHDLAGAARRRQRRPRRHPLRGRDRRPGALPRSPRRSGGRRRLDPRRDAARRRPGRRAAAARLRRERVAADRRADDVGPLRRGPPRCAAGSRAGGCSSARSWSAPPSPARASCPGRRPRRRTSPTSACVGGSPSAYAIAPTGPDLHAGRLGRCASRGRRRSAPVVVGYAADGGQRPHPHRPGQRHDRVRGGPARPARHRARHLRDHLGRRQDAGRLGLALRGRTTTTSPSASSGLSVSCSGSGS